MGTAERRLRERGQKHDAIVNAAVELFLSEGYEQTSIRKIAEKIEYTPGAIYSYFKDKDEILFEIHMRGFDKLFEVMNEANSIVDPLERLHMVGHLYLKFAMENPQYYDLMFIEESTARNIKKQEHWECGGHAYNLLRDVITACMESGKLPKADVDAASYGFWSMVHGMTSLVIRGRCLLCPPELHTELLKNTYDYMWAVIEGKR